MIPAPAGAKRRLGFAPHRRPFVAVRTALSRVLRVLDARSRHLLRRGRDWFPLTGLGAAVVPLILAATWAYGVRRQDVIVLAIGFGGLALTGLCVAQALLVATWLRLRPARPQGPLTLEVGRPAATGYEIGWIAWNPLIQIEIEWERPAGIEARIVHRRGRFVEEVVASRRSVDDVVVRRLIVSDVFGLGKHVIRRRRAQPVVARPGCGRPVRLPLVHEPASGEALAHPGGKPVGDPNEMRAYAPGDPLKLVLWKTYARTGRLLLRAPEPAAAPAVKTAAFLVAGEADEPAAGIARAALEAGALGPEFLFGADGAAAGTGQVAEALDLVLRSVRARDSGGSGLPGFLRHAASRGITGCVLFLPSRPGEWLDRVAEELGRRRGPCRAVVAVDGIGPSSPANSRLRGWLSTTPAGSETPRPALREVCRRLAACGADVLVADRTTGRTSRPREL